MGSLWSTYPVTLDDMVTMYSSKQKYQDLLSASDFKTLGTSALKEPIAMPMIFYILLPLVGMVLAMIFCLPVAFGICCCVPFRRYKRAQKKLDKVSKKFLKAQHIKLPPKSQPYDIAKASANLPEFEVVRKRQERLEKILKKNKQYRCLRCSVCMYVCWFAFAIVYVVSIISAALGTKKIVQIPTLNGMKPQLTFLDDFVGHTTKQVDKSVSVLFGTADILAQALDLEISEIEFNQTADTYVKKLKDAGFMEDPVQAFKDLIGKSGLNTWIHSLLFTQDWTATAKAAGQFFTDKLKDTNKVLTNIVPIKQQLSDIKVMAATIKITSIPDITFTGLPTDLNDAIKDVSLPIKIDEIITEILQTSPSLGKIIYKIYDGLRQNTSFQSFEDVLKLVLPYDIDGNYITDNADQTKYPKLEDILNNQNIDTSIISNIKQKVGDKVADLLTADMLFKGRKYLQIFKTFTSGDIDKICDQVFEQMNIVNPIPDWSIQIQKVAPSFLKKQATFNTTSQLINNVSPIIYAAVLVIPILIIFFSTLCMLCKCTCCSTCSIMTCCFCDICTVILGIVMLILSLLNSGLIQPATSTLSTDFQSSYDKLAPITTDLKKEITLTLPNITATIPGIKLSKDSITIELDSFSKILSSLKLDIIINLREIVKKYITYEENSSNQIEKLKEKIINKIGAGDTVISIDLSSSDFSKLFDATESVSLFSMLKNNGKSIADIVNDKVTEFLNKYVTDKKLNEFIASETVYGAIRDLNADKILTTAKINLDDITAKLTDIKTQIEISEIYCSTKKTDKIIQDNIPPKVADTNYIYVFDLIKGAMESIDKTPTSQLGSTSTIPNLNLPAKYGAEHILNIYAGIYMEQLALVDDDKLSKLIDSDAKKFVNDMANYSNALGVNGILNNIIDDSTSVFKAAPSFSIQNALTELSKVKGCAGTGSTTINNVVLTCDNTDTNATPDLTTDSMLIPLKQHGFSVISTPVKITQADLDYYNSHPSEAAAKTTDLDKKLDKIILYVKRIAQREVLVQAMKTIFDQIQPVLDTFDKDNQATRSVPQDAAIVSRVIVAVRDIPKLVTDLTTLVTDTFDLMLTNVLGMDKPTCTADGDIAEEAKDNASLDSLVNKFSPKFKDLINALIQNAANSLIPAKDTNDKQTKLPQVFTDIKLVDSLNKLLSNVNSVLGNLIYGADGIISSYLFALPIQVLQGTFNTIIGPFDSFSVACYLGFLFCFLGPMLMAFSYRYIIYRRFEKMRFKHYGVPIHPIECCSKKSKKNNVQVLPQAPEIPTGARDNIVVSAEQPIESPKNVAPQFQNVPQQPATQYNSPSLYNQSGWGKPDITF
ncbi:Conserved_hypothetical protein [Hexamita inflata]|uniref:Uncharacterized protein n=1 Tax=Hexamita inflata TaxID=28002 RepID=A0AA86UKL3_9EUKA|nr:Conserved hypothetical protein [Hexamita inflata]